MGPFVRLDGRTYEPNTDVGSLTVGDLGAVVGKVLVAPNPRGDTCYRLVDGAAVGLIKGTELRQVADYDPSFRLGVDVGGQLKLWEVTASDSARSGADMFDIEGRVTQVFYSRPEDGVWQHWQTTDAQIIQTVVQSVLDARVAGPQANGYGVAVLGLSLADGSLVKRAYEPRVNYLGQGIMLPAEFPKALALMQPILQR